MNALGISMTETSLFYSVSTMLVNIIDYVLTVGELESFFDNVRTMFVASSYCLSLDISVLILLD